MARFDATLPTELIESFEKLNINTSKMLGDMVTAGAEVARELVDAKMPRGLKESLTRDNLILTKVYKTPSDGGTNCQVMIKGYFNNRYGKKTPAPLVANMFEYGSSVRNYPRQPFFRQSFNRKMITTAMERVQEKYLKGEEG